MFKFIGISGSTILGMPIFLHFYSEKIEFMSYRI